MRTLKKIYICLFVGFLAGCEDLEFGNAFLEKPVSDDMSIDSVFSYKKYADQALNQFYKSLPDFMPMQYGYNAGAFIEDVFTDLGYSPNCTWNMCSMTPSSGDDNFPYNLVPHQNTVIIGDPLYGIRKAYIYIENVDKVPDMTTEEKKQRKAEAKVIIANHYIQMIRYYGGMPWIDHAYLPDETFLFPRMTIEETVNKTVELLDEAATDLPWSVPDEEYGHMTAAAAKALKFRLLLFAASPLFNNDTPYLEGAAANDRLVWYGNKSEERWRRALEAGKDFIRMNKANNDYYDVINTGNPREDYVNGYFVKGSREVLMASFRYATYAKGIKPFRTYEEGKAIPRGNYADMFQWKDGSDFDWNNAEHKANPFFDANGKPTRDIRLYETLLVNQDKWQGRKAEVYVGGREGTGTGSKVQSKTLYGYGYRKFIRDRHNEMDKKPYSCPLVRIPEVYLSLAEVMNHLGMANSKDEFGYDAYDYLNKVHTRAGLPAVTSDEVPEGEQLWNYLIDERAREFGHEEVHYFDMVRYRKGAEWATRPTTVLETTKVKNGFEYKVTVRDDIKYKWFDRMYLLPFPTSEINKKYGLIQNPGWE